MVTIDFTDKIGGGTRNRIASSEHRLALALEGVAGFPLNLLKRPPVGFTSFL